MKKLFLLFTFLAVAGWGASVRLMWDPSPSSGVTNYVIFVFGGHVTNANPINAASRINAGTNLTMRIDAIPPGPWTFGVAATVDLLESDPSWLHITIPNPPQRLRLQ